MADKRISQLIERVDIANNDVLPIVASGATTTNKVTISTIQDWMQSNLDVGVTSVGLTMPSAFQVSGSPITTSGNINVTATGTAGQYIRGDGTLADFPQGGGGGGASVSYYLNGSVSQGTIGGVAYLEMNKTPVLGAGTDFNISADGYIASFITDAGDPALLEIPAGNWNFETYFQASSGGGTPSFYVELYKVSGATATLIASNSANPELIAFGTSTTPYFSALAVPQTTLALTDRLAIRIYVVASGRTITLHTENSNLCQIITTFTTGLTALNGLTAQVQNFAIGTSGSNFGITSSGSIHTFNLPDASASARGVVTTGSQIFGGVKTFADGLSLPSAGGTNQASRFVNIGTIHQGSGGSNQIGFNNSNNIYFGKGLDNGGVIQWSNSAVRYYTLPNADGTIALTSDLGNYVPYTGATSNVDLGSNSLSSRNLIANGGLNTGALLLKNANNASLIDTGYFKLCPNSNNTEISFGFSTGASTWKQFNLSSTFITNNTVTTFYLPNGGGTLALTSQIPSNPVGGTGTTNQIPKFSGTSTLTNSNILDNGTEVNVQSRLFVTSGGQQFVFTPNLGTTSNRIETTGSLPLEIVSGGNITFAAGGTTPQITLATTGAATFSSTLRATEITASMPSGNGALYINNSSLTSKNWTFIPSTNAGETDLLLFYTGAGAGTKLTLASTGAATFSSSVTANLLSSLNQVIANNSITTPINDNTLTNGTVYALNGISTTNNYGIGVSGIRNGNYDIWFQTGSTNGGGYRFYKGTTELMTIATSGNVGIGTPTPQYKFEVSDGSRTGVFNPNSIFDGFFIGVKESKPLVLGTGDTERMRITSTGNVGIGTPSPASKLDVSGEIRSTSTSGYAALLSISALGYSILADTHTGGAMTIFTEGSEKMRITSAGNVGIGTNSPSQSLNVVGNGRFEASSGNRYIEVASSTSSIQFGTDGSSQFIYGVGSFPMTFSTAGTERMRITSGGNVGIGTNSPTRPLVIYNSSAATLYQTPTSGTTANDGFYVGQTSDVSYVWNYNNFPLAFGTNNIERMRLTSGGHLLVGNSTDSDPSGSGTQGIAVRGDGILVVGKNGAYAADFGRNTNDGELVRFRRSGSAVGNISVTTTATSYNTSSDYRLKENVKPVENALSVLTQLKPCTFNFIADADEEVMGFIAHEVQEVIPQAVTGEKDAVRIEQVEVSPAELDEEGNVITEAVIEEKEVPVYQGIDHSKLVPLLVAAIQEQQEQIKSLTEQVEALKSQING